jgi:hypothetical protein
VSEAVRWQDAWRVYLHGRIAAMLCLGFSAGLPFLLVFSTLSAWLTEAGVSRTAIGLFSWVGITYSIKVLWAPVVDRLELPLLYRLLGRRRSWILLAQLAIAGGLAGMAYTDPSAISRAWPCSRCWSPSARPPRTWPSMPGASKRPRRSARPPWRPPTCSATGWRC